MQTALAATPMRAGPQRMRPPGSPSLRRHVYLSTNALPAHRRTVRMLSSDAHMCGVMQLARVMRKPCLPGPTLRKHRRNTSEHTAAEDATVEGTINGTLLGNAPRVQLPYSSPQNAQHGKCTTGDVEVRINGLPTSPVKGTPSTEYLRPTTLGLQAATPTRPQPRTHSRFRWGARNRLCLNQPQWKPASGETRLCRTRVRPRSPHAGGAPHPPTRWRVRLPPRRRE